MPVTREFIDWSAPALPEVVRRLMDRFGADGFVDLSQVIVVTPGARSGRRFLELLAEMTEGRNSPPRVLTPGALPEELYEPQRPFADDLTQNLAWAEALQSIPSDQVRLIVGKPPREGDIKAWLSLGKVLGKVHREFAGDLLDFTAVLKLPSIEATGERDRWGVLAEVQRVYLEILEDPRNQKLWDRQTARRVAVERRECRTDRLVVLIGTVDMNGTLRGMIDQIADQVLVFVHAPNELADRFDDFGVLKSDAWEQVAIELPDSLLRFVDGPADQATAVAEALSGLRGRRRVDEILIGLADESLASPVRAALGERGIDTRWIGARTLADSLPFRLLEAIADWLEDDRTSQSLALIRHPQVGGWLERQNLGPNWLSKVDEEVAQRAPRFLGRSKSSEGTLSQRVGRLIDSWLADLQGAPRPLGGWRETVLAALRVVYDGAALRPDQDVDRESRAALERIRELISEQADVPERLAASTTAAVAIRLVLDAAGSDPSPPAVAPDAVEMLGWLELPLDDAPVLVVAGFNEGSVPSALNHDLFLPNTLREQLGLEDNRRRYARDAYAANVLRHSRPSLTLTIGRRTAKGDPLLPSRLLFATSPEEIAKRVVAMLHPKAAVTGAATKSETPQPFGFRIPRPTRSAPQPLKLPVTAFADYLACPYRFYLKYIEKLDTFEPADDELTALSFGSMVHEIFQRWALGPRRDCCHPGDLAEYLSGLLDVVVSEELDESPLPAVQLQIEQARLRLISFAAWQAKWASEGWRVKYVEQSCTCTLPIDERRMATVSGRIDRIDYHADNDAWAIFDYKTGEGGMPPEKTHRKKDEWVDLQLPLYRRMARTFGVDGNVQMGYLILPKATGSAGSQMAEWTAEELAAADDVALRVVREIADGRFWPPTVAPGRLGEFDPICLEGVFGREHAL